MEATQYPPLQSVAEQDDSWRKWLAALLAGGLWLVLINALRLEWSLNEQYSYGWVVPVLALYLLWERCKDAPSPAKAFSPAALCVLAGICAFSFFPLRLLLEANPDWRLPDWGLALAVVGLSFATLLYAGGWAWLRHFGFPIAFFLVSVPWPVPFEQNVMQHLMRGNAWMSVQALVWCGLPAVQMGNVIRIPNGGVVGIDEACSGVRSLQTTLMISLFLGELYRFPIVRRLLLLVAAVCFALLCNLGRTFFLVWLSAARGIHEMTKWHDTAGLTVLVVCVAGLWEMAHLFRSRGGALEEPGKPSAAWLHGRLPPGKVLAGLALWFLFSEVATELWYRSHEWNRAATTHWSVDFPVMAPHFQDTEIPENTKVILKYNEGRAGKWVDTDGSHWTMFFFRWFPGRASATLAKGHKPEICLPSAGLHMDEFLGIKEVKAGPVTLPFRSYVFDYQGRRLDVFYCLWEDQQEHVGTQAQLPEDRKAWTKVLAVMAGKRNLGQQVLEITISGFDNEDDAFAELQRKVAAMVVKA